MKKRREHVIVNKIAGRLWTIGEKPLGGKWGLTEWPERRISIEIDASDKMKLDALIHEVIHASCDNWIEDEKVEMIATAVAEVLWKWGWRPTE